MVTKVLVRDTFIHGHIQPAGTIIDLDANDPTGYAVAGSTPVMAMTDEQLRSELERRGASAKPEPTFSDNVADPTVQNTGAIAMPIADIAPRSPGSTEPQGLPPGGRLGPGGQVIYDAGPDAPGAVQIATGPSQEAQDAVTTADTAPAAGDTLTKAEIVDALKARGDTVDSSKTKAELQEQLATPPAA